MVDASCGGTFMLKSEDDAWTLFENLSENSLHHSSSGCRTNAQSQTLYEVFQPPSNSTFEEKVLTSLSKFESQAQILNSHSQFIAKLEVQLGQLAKSFNEREIGKCSSPPVINPRSGGVVINPKVGETKTESIGQLEKTKLAKGKGVFTEAPHSTTHFLEAHFKPEVPYPLSLKDLNGHETINFFQPLPDTDPFISSEF
jgi:hypothetical protein